MRFIFMLYLLLNCGFSKAQFCNYFDIQVDTISGNLKAFSIKGVEQFDDSTGVFLGFEVYTDSLLNVLVNNGLVPIDCINCAYTELGNNIFSLKLGDFEYNKIYVRIWVMKNQEIFDEFFTESYEINE